MVRLLGSGGGTDGLGTGSEPFTSCPLLELALSGPSFPHQPLCTPPLPSSHGLPHAHHSGLNPPQASPTDACLPVRMEHKLDMAAAPGTLLCVITSVLAATVTIVACHCTQREKDTCQLASPWVPPFSPNGNPTLFNFSPPYSLLLPAAEAPHSLYFLFRPPPSQSSYIYSPAGSW